MEDLYDEGQIP